MNETLITREDANAPDIAKLKANRDIDGLIQALTDVDWDLCRDVVKALGEIGDPRAVEPLIAIVYKEKPNSSFPPAFPKRYAIEALGAFAAQDSSVIQPLIKILQEQDWYQDEAIGALAKVGKPAVEPLIATINKSSGQPLRRVAVVLGKIGDKRAVQPLIPVLKNSDWAVRLWTVWALGELGDESAVEYITPLLKDEKPQVREEASKALERLGGELAKKAITEQPQAPQPVIKIGMTMDEVISLIGKPRDEGVSGADILGRNTADLRSADVFLYFDKHPDLDYSIRFSKGKVMSIQTYTKR